MLQITQARRDFTALCATALQLAHVITLAWPFGVNILAIMNVLADKAGKRWSTSVSAGDHRPLRWQPELSDSLPLRLLSRKHSRGGLATSCCEMCCGNYEHQCRVDARGARGPQLQLAATPAAGAPAVPELLRRGAANGGQMSPLREALMAA